MHTAGMFRIAVSYGERSINRDLRGKTEYLMAGNRSRWQQVTAVRKALEFHQRIAREPNHEDVRLIEVVPA